MLIQDKFCQVEYAESFLSRFAGLMMRNEIDDDYALVFRNCSSVHSHFMRFPIDVIYMSQDGSVLKIEKLSPWRIGKAPAGSRHIVECGAEQARKHGIQIGDKYAIEPQQR